MKNIVLTLMALFAISTIFSACEKTEYKHPLHRAQGK